MMLYHRRQLSAAFFPFSSCHGSGAYHQHLQTMNLDRTCHWKLSVVPSAAAKLEQDAKPQQKLTLCVRSRAEDRPSNQQLEDKFQTLGSRGLGQTTLRRTASTSNISSMNLHQSSRLPR